MPLIDVVLADQDALLPWPGSPGRIAPQGEFRVDTAQPFWAQCLADGSVLAAPAAEEKQIETKPASKFTSKA